MTAETALTRWAGGLSEGLQTAVALWADSTTDPSSPRRQDLLRDKGRALFGFFQYVNKNPEHVSPADVKLWQQTLEDRGLAPATIYSYVSRVSSFFSWAMDDPRVAQRIKVNPVDRARPKAPKAYQNESARALSDDDLCSLLAVVQAKAANEDDVVGKRDYALLLMYVLTGMRRREVISLRWGDVQLNGTLVVTTKFKGGEYGSREIADPAVRAALIDYLEASGRLGRLEPNDPLWTRHDRAGAPGEPLTSHAFVHNLKRYAKEAGIGDVHLHRMRHTFARMVAEDTGSLIETQDALGHKNLATTRVYVQRIATKRDKHSRRIAARLGL